MAPRDAPAEAPGSASPGPAFPDPAVDYRAHPERYRVGRGEQGVLTVQPYKSELLPHWRFKTPEAAAASASRIYELFVGYREQGDFVGMDMARKFLQMGYTRSQRYAVHRDGRKYGADGSALPPLPDAAKAAAAEVFAASLRRVREDEAYVAARRRHQALVADATSPRPRRSYR